MQILKYTPRNMAMNVCSYNCVSQAILDTVTSLAALLLTWSQVCQMRFFLAKEIEYLSSVLKSIKFHCDLNNRWSVKPPDVIFFVNIEVACVSGYAMGLAAQYRPAELFWAQR